MMEEDFYATLKLKTGEEIFAKVAASEENEKTMLILSNPIMIGEIKSKSNVVGYKVEPWIKTSTEDMFIINRDHIITISEVNDDIQEFYEKTLVRMDGAKALGRSGNKLPRGSGYLGSVKEMKKSLEDIYNKS